MTKVSRDADSRVDDAGFRRIGLGSSAPLRLRGESLQLLVKRFRNEEDEKDGEEDGDDEADEGEEVVEGERTLLGARPTQNQPADDRRQDSREEGAARGNPVHGALWECEDGGS